MSRKVQSDENGRFLNRPYELIWVVYHNSPVANYITFPKGIYHCQMQYHVPKEHITAAGLPSQPRNGGALFTLHFAFCISSVADGVVPQPRRATACSRRKRTAESDETGRFLNRPYETNEKRMISKISTGTPPSFCTLHFAFCISSLNSSVRSPSIYPPSYTPTL